MLMRNTLVAFASVILLSSTASAGLVVGNVELNENATLHSGTVGAGQTLSYVSGSDGQTGTADGTNYAFNGDGPATALAGIDHHWAQFDPGIVFYSAFATSAVLAIPAIDHGWAAGNTGEGHEPFEFQIFGCTDASASNCIAGVITDVWALGVDDTSSSKNADDYTSRWAFNGLFNYFLLTSGDHLINNSTHSPGEGEIDALALDVPEPSSIALLGLAFLSLFGLGIARRRAVA